MSSVASKQALLIALGGVSIAALFVWYLQTKRQDAIKKKPSRKLNGNVRNTCDVVDSSNEETDDKKQVVEEEKETVEQNGHAQIEREPVIVAEKEEENGGILKDEKLEAPQQAAIQEEEEKKESVEVEVENDDIEHQEEEDEKSEEEEQVEVAIENQETVGVNSVDSATVEQETEEVIEKVEIVTEQAAPLEKMAAKKKTVENEQIPEEPTPTKILDKPLLLDIDAQMSPAFSWSEEMEQNGCDDLIHECSDMDPSPVSPSYSSSLQRKSGSKNKSRKGKNVHISSKKPQRRLNGDQITEERVREDVGKKAIIDASGDAGCQKNEDESYEKSDSPGLASQNSEASSQDSGRATGGLASSLSPMDENFNPEDDLLPMYEFEIPNTLVGLIIGIKGKTIKELSTRTNVRMLIRQHHTPEKLKTHQICQVRGKRDEINHCLQMLRRRFPSPRFPELNLQPVLPPPVPNNTFDMLSTQPTWLTLPEDIKCEIAVSAVIDPSHFFIHQPTHPSFASLRYLDMYMMRLYGENSNLPELPIPCQDGLLCAAPVKNAWFRAVTVQYYEESDEVFVKFVDYGGYTKMARQDLRQIRTDLMSLPFQCTEVMLAHVRPVDGTLNWGEEAMHEFNKMCTGGVINCKVVGYSIENRIPMVELYVSLKDVNGELYEIRFDQHLMEKGLARTADPSKMSRPSLVGGGAGAVTQKRPSLASQTSQTTAVC